METHMGTSRILTPRKFYRPFEYQHYFEYFQKQNQAHWMPTEVPMEADIADYKFRLSEEAALRLEESFCTAVACDES